MKLVLFLGAGFSQPFGLPTMNRFLEAVASSDRLTAEDRAFVGELVLEARRANSFLESSPQNLEDILSFAVMGDRLGLFGSEGKERSSRIRHVLHRIYSYPAKVEEFWDRYDVLRTFLGGDVGTLGSELSIVTTNYDLNAECALLRLQCLASLPFEYVPCTAGKAQRGHRLYGGAGTGEVGSVPLFKLHGSLNWYVDPSNPNRVEVDGRVVPVGRGAAEIPYPCVNNYEIPGTPAIVPPSFIKPDLPEFLKVSWNGAAHALSRADLIVFVGYSFPPSDTEMRYFLGRALSDNPGLQRIIVVDPYSNEIVRRLTDQSSGFGSHFKSFLQPQTGAWEGLRLSLYGP